MATYLVLNCLFLCVVLLLLRVLNGRIVWNQSVTVTLIVLLVLTAIFDSVIVASGIVAYDETKILGMSLGSAPIEDFFYAVLAAVLIPNLWHIFQKENHGQN